MPYNFPQLFITHLWQVRTSVILHVAMWQYDRYILILLPSLVVASTAGSILIYSYNGFNMLVVMVAPIGNSDIRNEEEKKYKIP